MPNLKFYFTAMGRVVDPDLDWIWIQWIFGSGFRMLIRIQWQEIKEF
jgi:hypothetical protein